MSLCVSHIVVRLSAAWPFSPPLAAACRSPPPPSTPSTSSSSIHFHNLPSNARIIFNELYSSCAAAAAVGGLRFRHRSRYIQRCDCTDDRRVSAAAWRGGRRGMMLRDKTCVSFINRLQYDLDADGGLKGSWMLGKGCGGDMTTTTTVRNVFSLYIQSAVERMRTTT